MDKNFNYPTTGRGMSREMNGGFWCKYCGKQKAWDDKDYDFGLYLAVVANFEALRHTEYVTPYLICRKCADEAKRRMGKGK